LFFNVNFSAHVLPFSDEYFPSFFASHNLRVFVDHAVKTVQNRFDQCLETLIDFLNSTKSTLFGANGPHPDLKQYLCPPAHEGNVLKAFLPPGYQGRVFPRNMKDAKNMPIQSSPTTPTNLVLALGCLRMFDVSSNSAVPTQTPQCTFAGNFAPAAIGESLIKGAKSLDRYGPLGFEIMYTVAAGLGGEFLKVCKVKKPDQVDAVLNEAVVRWA
jgi:hypothetical protein